MYNKKVLGEAVKKLGSAKAPTKKQDTIYNPKEEGIILDLSPEEIEEYRKGGYIIENISTPSLSHMGDGGSPYYSYGNKKYIKKKDGTWFVESNGEYVPLTENVKARTAELNKNAKYNAGSGETKPLTPVKKVVKQEYFTTESGRRYPMYDSKGNYASPEARLFDEERNNRSRQEENLRTNYHDAPINMVYPEVLAIGPGGGLLNQGLKTGVGAIEKVAAKEIPGLFGTTVGQALGAGFAADAVVNRLPQIPGQIARGEYLDAGINAGTGVLDVMGLGLGKNLISEGITEGKKIVNSIDNAIYPTRTYRAEVPGGNLSTWDASDLSKKVFNKGDFSTKSLDDVTQYLSGSEGGRKGLLTGQDMNFTEYKVPFWKKDVSFDPDVIELKKSQNLFPNSDEYIIPKNKFLYPRKTTLIKAVPEELKTFQPDIFSGDLPFEPYNSVVMKQSNNFASKPFRYIEDQLNAVTGHNMPLTYKFDPSIRNQVIPNSSWKQPQFPVNKSFKYGGLNKYEEEGMILDLTPEEIKQYAKGGYIIEDISLPSLNYKKGGALLTKKVTCKKCGWTWDAADGGNNMTTCHKCGGKGLIHAQNGGDLPPKVGVSYLPKGERSYYDPIMDNINLDSNASEGELNHEMAHAWQNRQDGFRSDPYSPKLRPLAAASDEQAATYFNRKGDDVDRYLNNLNTIVPELGGHTWNKDIDTFIPDQIKYDKVIDPLMYSDPTTLEGEAEYMAQVYGRPPLEIRKYGGLHKFVGGGEPCPNGYEKDYLGINCIPMTVPEQVNDEDWYKNWYANRIIQDEEGQNLLETARPKILKRTENFPEIVRYSNPFTSELGSFEPLTGKITLNEASLKNNPFRKNEVLFHEKGHYLTSPSLVNPETDTPEKVDAHPIQQLRNYEAGVVEEALKPRKDVPRKDRKYYDYLKGKGKNKKYTEEISKMLMGARRLGEFQPDQEITDKDIEDLYKKAEEKGWLNPNSDFFSEPLYNLKEYTKSPEQIKILFNKLAENKSDNNNEYEPQIVKYGGSLHKFIDGGQPCLPGQYWNGKQCVQSGNPLYQNNALNKGSLIDQKITATEKKGMAYQATADELKRLYAQKAQEKAKQDAIKRKAANQKKRDELAKQQLIEQEFNAQINPNKTYSETLGTVAGNAGAAQTQGALDAQIGAKQEYHQKRKFVTDNYLNTNRDALINEAARSIQNSSNLTYEQALEQAKQDEALLYSLAEKHTPTDSEHLTNLANSQDFYDHKNSRNDQIKSIDPNDPTHISFENTGTLEGYMQRANDIVLNPLDAAHYAISNEKMPYNFSEYEKMKQQTGYRDGADNNAVMGAIDFASWFHPVGLFGQGMKMIEPTAESILKVYDNPTWENAGDAAFDIGMTGLTLLASKNPLKFLAEEKFAADAATGFRNWNPAQSGPTPPFNTGTGLLPVGVATEVRAASEAATGTTPLLNITPIGFNPKMEIEGATVYNQLLEQKRLQDIAGLSKISSSSDPVAINLEAQIAKLKEQEALAEESRKVLWGDYKAGNITAEEYTAGAKKLSPGLEGTNPRFELEKQLREYKVKQDIINVPQQNILQSEEQLGKNISDGGTNTKGVFELGDDHVARLSAWGYDDASLLVKYADKIKSPRIAKTLQVKELNGKVYQVQEKVAGTPIASLTETELQNIPKEHIDNFWKDKAELDNLGLSIDISGGKSNILYDPKKGFQFIDLGIGESSTNEVIAQTYKGLKLPIEETGLVKNVSGTTPLVQEEKVFGVAPTEIIESSTTVPRKNLNDPEYVDDEVVADIIDDMRINKMELWNTPEGKARLQKMIDNTDSLRSNLEMTPETIIERMGSLNVVNRIRVNTETKLKALEEEEAFIDELYDTGQIDKTEWMDKIVAVDEKRNIQNLLLTEIEKGVENFSGFYDPQFNRIGIKPKDYNKKEIKKVTAHEFMHLLGNGRTTYLDDMLNDLDLIEDTSTQLTIPGIGGGEESKAAALFGHDRPDYLEESLDYFKTGSRGTEKVPFISEIRQVMLEDGTIKNEYDKITPDMLKKHYEKYKKNKDEKYPIRLYDIIKDDKKNFTILSKVLDNLPIVLQAIGMADALFGQEDVDTKEAGFSLLLGAITKGKGKALKAGKNLKKFTGLMNAGNINAGLSPELLANTVGSKNVVGGKLANFMTDWGLPIGSMFNSALDVGSPVGSLGSKFLSKISPLNFIPKYGEKIEGATVSIGDILASGVKNGKVSVPKSLFKQAKNIIKKSDDAVLTVKNNKTNANIYTVKIDPNVKDTKVNISGVPEKQGLLSRKKNASFKVTNKKNVPLTEIKLEDPGVIVYRKLPFSNRYAVVDKAKLIEGKNQWATTGASAQKFAESYGKGLLITGAGGALLWAAEPSEETKKEAQDKWVKDEQTKAYNNAVKQHETQVETEKKLKYEEHETQVEAEKNVKYEKHKAYITTLIIGAIEQGNSQEKIISDLHSTGISAEELIQIYIDNGVPKEEAEDYINTILRNDIFNRKKGGEVFKFNKK